MIYDCFTYNGETAMLKLHLSILGNYVDKFIIIEANKTFTGYDKPLYFFRDQRFFKEWWNKIDYFVVNEWDDPTLWELAMNSPHTQGASHWKREFYIKESIHKALKASKVQDDDTVFIGDVDEIIDPTATFESDDPIKAKLRVYTYYLNNLSSEQFWGTLIAQYKDIKDKCLNHMRADTALYSKGEPLGWHFTSQGGLEEMRRKFDATYTEESGNTHEFQELLAKCYKENTDFMKRDFTFTTDDSNWPAYLKRNRTKYQHLCK